MESQPPITSLEPGAPVSTVFLLKEKRLAVSKAGKSYLTLKLSDRQTEVEAKLWDDADLINGQLEANMPVEVEGVVSVYRERHQLTIRRIKTLPWSPELFDQLVPVSRFSLEEMRQELDTLLDTIRNPHLRRLVDELRGDTGLMERFTAVPAAKMIHHAYVRGLLEHTLSMMKIASMLADHYEHQFPGRLDREVLLLGTLLHDIGKTTEYEYERGIEITDRGRLLGHLVLGIEVINDAVSRIPDFPMELADRVKHLIVSHHGDFEKGAPLRPVTLEAQLLHLVDYLDSQVNAVGSLLAGAGDEDWTAWSSKFERRFYNRGPVSTLEPSGLEAPPTEDQRPAPASMEAPPTEEPPPPDDEFPDFLEEPSGLEAPPTDGQRPSPTSNLQPPTSDSDSEAEAEEEKPKRRKKNPSLPGLF